MSQYCQGCGREMVIKTRMYCTHSCHGRALLKDEAYRALQRERAVEKLRMENCKRLILEKGKSSEYVPYVFTKFRK
jgi:hypothetical protein